MRINIIVLVTIVAGMFSLSGCIVVPAHGHGHRHGYGSGVYVNPPPIIIHRDHSGSRWGGRHWRRW